MQEMLPLEPLIFRLQNSLCTRFTLEMRDKS